MKNLLTATELIAASERLERLGSQYKKLDYYMANTYGIDWDDNVVYVEIYNFLNSSMYYDEKFQYWVDK